MKALKKWVLIAGLCVPVLGFGGCPGNFGRQLWDSAIDGAAGFVELTTFELLEANVNLDAADE